MTKTQAQAKAAKLFNELVETGREKSDLVALSNHSFLDNSRKLVESWKVHVFNRVQFDKKDGLGQNLVERYYATLGVDVKNPELFEIYKAPETEKQTEKQTPKKA